MKILNMNKNNTLAIFYFALIVFPSFTTAINLPHSDDSNLNKKNSEDFMENLENKIQKKINLRKYKKSFKIKTFDKNHTNNQDITDKQIEFIENFTKNQNKNESYIYASWFIFVPLVLLIFIMTILSIAGFLILILNSTNSSSSNDKKTLLRNQITRLNRNNLSNQEIIDILRLKHHKKNKKENHSNYKTEPEPEAILLGI